MTTKISLLYVCCDLEEPVFPYFKKNVLLKKIVLTILFLILSLLVFPRLILLFRRFQVGDTIPA